MFETAGITLLNVAAQICSAAYLEGMHNLQMGQRQRVMEAVCLAKLPEYISHFPLRSLLC